MGQNRDGTTRIHTNKGDLDVRLRGKDIPEQGQRVEIDLPPGRPPRQAVIRPAPDTSSPSIRTDAAPAESPRRSDPGRPPDRASSTQEAPRESRAQNVPAPRISDPVSSGLALPTEEIDQIRLPLQAGDVVRLLPLPPREAAQIPLPVFIDPPLESTLSLTALKTVFLALLTAESAQNENFRSAAEVLHTDAVTPAPAPSPAGALFTAPPHIKADGFFPLLAPTPFALTESLSAGHTPPVSASSFFHFLPVPPVIASPPSAQTSVVSPHIQSAAPTVQIAAALPPAPVTTAETETPSPAPSVTTLTTAPQSAPAPGHIDIRIIDIVPPSPVLSPVPVIPLPATKTGALQTIVPASHTPAAVQKNPLTATTTTAAAARPETLLAQVTGATPDKKLPVLSLTLPGRPWPDHFILQFSANNLAPGSLIEFVPQTAGTALNTPLPSESAITLPTLPTPLYDLFSAFTWPALDDIQQTLQQLAPQMAQAMTATLPSPATAPQRLPAAALFFIAAIRSGDLSSWLGEKTVDMLRRGGRADAITRLSRDISGLSKSAAEPVSQDWRALTLPVHDGQQDIQKMMLYWRQDREKEENEDDRKNRGTRFIFDLSLSRMGPVQLDGLHRQGRLDLILRTPGALSADMQQAVRRAWINALEQTELSGEISFQNKPEQFVKIDVPAETQILSL